MVRVAKDSFPKLEQVHLTLTADQLKRAEAEIRETGTTSDRDVSLLMRRKIQALSIWTEPLGGSSGRYDEIALSIMDPVSSAIFFTEKYPCSSTNERAGSLHLHGLLWLDGNVQLPSLIDDMANPDEGAYRASGPLRRFRLHECLDEDAGKAVRKERKPIQPIAEMMASSQTLTAAFDDESNFIAHCCQVHSHTFTCLKYSLKGLVEEGTDKHRRTACRFKAPWKLVEETGFTDDGLLRIRRNHPLVNRYNKSLAIGLRHNHDVSMILTRTKGLAMVYYITNYATKLDTPMWKRLALAADVARQLRESGSARCRATESSQRNHRHEAS
ncbi:reverse transcriptase [Purpureocillium lavendulum]|uniref:Reverse transcriptase n=1 Tax=Purpureocillium lavendulum TaxID=1247861 RepID=A0AB34FAD4_9HYPO|nr:reverse transcriptase [Purpureocillium lavendulum]